MKYKKNNIHDIQKLLNKTLKTLPNDKVCPNDDNVPNWYDNEDELTQEELESL